MDLSVPVSQTFSGRRGTTAAIYSHITISHLTINMVAKRSGAGQVKIRGTVHFKLLVVWGGGGGFFSLFFHQWMDFLNDCVENEKSIQTNGAHLDFPMERDILPWKKGGVMV